MNKKIYIIPSEKIAILDTHDFLAASGDTEGSYETNTEENNNGGEGATARTQGVWDSQW